MRARAYLSILLGSAFGLARLDEGGICDDDVSLLQVSAGSVQLGHERDKQAAGPVTTELSRLVGPGIASLAASDEEGADEWSRTPVQDERYLRDLDPVTRQGPDLLRLGRGADSYTPTADMGSHSLEGDAREQSPSLAILGQVPNLRGSDEWAPLVALLGELPVAHTPSRDDGYLFNEDAVARPTGLAMLSVDTKSVAASAPSQPSSNDVDLVKLLIDEDAVPSSVMPGQAPHQHISPGISLGQEASLMHNSTNETYIVKRDCLVNTGGTCSLDNCHKDRGPTSCRYDTCVCAEGCAGADGTCRKEKNKVILPDFTMRNFRWQTYLSANGEPLGGLQVTSQPDSLSNHFTLMETGDGEFIIYSQVAPDYAVTISTQCSGYRSYGCHLEPSQVDVKGSDGVGFDPPTKSVALTLTAPPGGYNDKRRDTQYDFNGTHPVMLQSFEHSRHYIYSPAASIGDAPAVSHDDPGDGALWIFEPPLPVEYFIGENRRVEQFRGLRCRWDCHGQSKTAKFWFWVSGIVAVVLLCCCFLCVGCYFCDGGHHIQ